MPIEVLSELTIAQIAAGEVVERPASVVKELIENALDAGADNIHVAVAGGGRKLIRISDNGSGILADEVELAFARHATSKLRTVDDLSSIGTLGFRGEALASIAAVSRISLMTRYRGEDVGTEIRIEGGRLIEHQATGAPVGTVISIENLFFNTPARLKFLKKESTEKKHITMLVTRYALAYPDVRFTLEQDGRELFRSTGTGQLADTMVRVVGLDNFKQMIEIDSLDPARDDRPTVKVYGFTSLPKFSRSDRTHISLFINGRWIQDSTLTYAVVQAYHTLLTGGRYPVATLMIAIAPQEVDVNVHPTKAEVRFRNPNAVFSAVQRAVREAVISTTDVRDPQAFRRDLSGSEPHWGDDRQQMGMSLPIDDPGRFPRVEMPDYSNDDGDDPTSIPVGPGAPLKPRTLPMLRVVGQVGATYIVAEGPAGMYLIDQHTAHQRVIYEKLHDGFASTGSVLAQEISAQTIDLTVDETRLIGSRLDTLRTCGFVLEPFGPSTYVIRAVPEVIAGLEPVDVLGAIINDLATSPKVDEMAFRDLVFRRICHQAAVKSGQILGQEEMQALIRQLERCEMPREDPNGQPTLLHMSGEQLARQFGR